MKLPRTVEVAASTLVVTILIAACIMGTSFLKGCVNSSTSDPQATTATPALTRGQVAEIVRAQIRHAFALRDWHRYSYDITEYQGEGVSDLFSLSPLDLGTAVGARKANLRIIVYADFECPFCKLFETRTAPILQKQFAGKALFVYRFYPLAMHGAIAKSESLAGVCVALTAGPAAFRRFSGTVFALTRSNGHGTAVPTQEIVKQAIGATEKPALLKRFTACTHGKAAPALIAASSTFPGVIGTPTIFMVNLSKHQAWRLAGALPAWVFETMAANILAGRPGGSDGAVGKFGPPE